MTESEALESVPVWIVAGAPGTGKTTFAHRLVSQLHPRPALLDKDTVYGAFVTATLRASGRPPGEREGDWYDENIKLHEYAGLIATTREVRAGGCPVVLVAPFTAQIHDLALWSSMVDDLGGEAEPGTVHLVWVHCGEATLRRRIIERGSVRDGNKLADFDGFVARIRLTEPPAVAHMDICTD